MFNKNGKIKSNSIHMILKRLIEPIVNEFHFVKYLLCGRTCVFICKTRYTELSKLRYLPRSIYKNKEGFKFKW